MIPPEVPDYAIGVELVEVDVRKFDPGTAVASEWSPADRCLVHVSAREEIVMLLGNVPALQSLARHCLTLAQQSQEESRLEFDKSEAVFETDDWSLRLERNWD